MTLKLASIAISTAVLMSIGQLLFKMGADQIQGSNLQSHIWQIISSPILIMACTLYALTILIWIWVLKHAPLSIVYPFTACAYIITPLLSYLIFDEKLNFQFIIGTAFLVLGIIICSTAQVVEYVDR